jgi:hypothetical protein
MAPKKGSGRLARLLDVEDRVRDTDYELDGSGCEFVRLLQGQWRGLDVGGHD